MGAAPAEGAAATPAVETFTAFGNTLSLASSSFAASAASLPNAATAFQSVFSSGASQIGNAGAVAGSTLTSMAGTAGDILGQRAGAAVQAAVGGLTINVNANVVGKGVDSGSMKASGGD